MRILMVAPEPCFQPRGTPFSVYHRIAALLGLGHSVDLVTYHLGDDADLQGLRIFRSLRLPFVRHVKVGPSWTKILLDMLLFVRCLVLILTHRYDAIHTHEEAGFLGAVFGSLLRIPHIYDMHSDLAQQLTNFQFTQSRLLIGLMHWVQRVILWGSDVVIVICPDLERRVKEIYPDKQVVLIENTSMLGSMQEPSASQVAALRRELGLDGRRVLLYTGTMERYQGLDVLLRSVDRVVEQHSDVVYLLVGGQEQQIGELRKLASTLGVEQHVVFAGIRPSHEMWLYMALAEILLSPRLRGTNTPLKIYAYLRAGRPTLATNLLTHTQVLDEQCALLVEPTPQALAQGALQLLADRAFRQELADNSLRLAEAKYTYQAFVRKTALVYEMLPLQGTPR